MLEALLGAEADAPGVVWVAAADVYVLAQGLVAEVEDPLEQVLVHDVLVEPLDHFYSLVYYYQ